MPPVELVSPLPLDECMRRVCDNVDEGFIGVLPIIGRFQATEFELWRRNGNRFRTVLAAALVPMSDRTLIRCSFGTNPQIVLKMRIFVGLTLAALAIFVTDAILHPPGEHFRDFLEALSIPVLMLCFYIGALKLGLFLARNDESILTQFLRDTIDARHISDQPAISRGARRSLA
jgi:hypothetical protein